jgi:hypothetical protein
MTVFDRAQMTGALIASNIERTSDDDLRAVIEDVKRRHLELALEDGPLVRSAECAPAGGAPASETYGNPGELELILEKIRRNGGELRYLDMDEPFFFGHRDPSGCHLPATRLAQQVATSVASARRIFPGLQVGGSEVVTADRQLNAELVQWVDAYRAATGEPLAFFHADVQWSELAMRNLVALAAQLKERRIPFGIIYAADGGVASDLEWTQSAVRHFTEIEQVLNLRPDHALFATWVPYPQHVLPENEPGTLMNMPLQYLRASPALRLSQSGQDITGTLSGRDGEPVAGAAIPTDGCRRPVIWRAPFPSTRRRLSSASGSDWKGLAYAPVQPQPWSEGFTTGSRASRHRTSLRSARRSRAHR